MRSLNKTGKLTQTAKRMLMAILSLSFVFVSACQPTPDKPFVESKNDGELEAAIYGSPAPNEKYEAPETWQESFSREDGGVVVNIDAKITIPDVTAFPVYRVDSPAFTEEEMADFVTRMTDGKQLYTVDGTTRTKDVIQAEIEKIMNEYEPNSRMMQALASGELSQEEFDYYKEVDNNTITQLQEEYKKAPVNSSLVETTFKLETPKEESVKNYKFFHAIVKNGGSSPGYVELKSIQTKPYGAAQIKYYNSSASERWLESGFGTIDPNTAAYTGRYVNLEHLSSNMQMAISYDEAKSIADNIFNKLGYENYYMANACGVNRDAYDGETDMKSEYMFVYLPVIDDIPVLRYTLDTWDNEGNRYFADSYPHCVAVYVRDAQRYEVYEQSKLTLQDKLTTNAPLLSFEEIQDICRKYMPIAANAGGLYIVGEASLEKITYNVTDIKLGYLSIREKNNNERSLLVPVWNLYGNQVNKYSEEATDLVLNENNEHLMYDAGNVFLCINALDGSIINLDLGY